MVQKKVLWFFLPWRYGLSSSTTHPPRFPSRNIIKNVETHPPPIRDVIIEQPLMYFLVYESRGWIPCYIMPILFPIEFNVMVLYIIYTRGFSNLTFFNAISISTYENLSTTSSSLVLFLQFLPGTKSSQITYLFKCL